MGKKGIQSDSEEALAPISLTIKIKGAHMTHHKALPYLVDLLSCSYLSGLQAFLVLFEHKTCLRALTLAISLVENTLTCLQVFGQVRSANHDSPN